MARNFYGELKKSTTTDERVDLAKDINCPPDLLKSFVTIDTEYPVIIAAALNPNCPSNLLEIAATRSGWPLDLLTLRKEESIREYELQTKTDGKMAAGDRDSMLLSHILRHDNKHAESHLGDFTIRKNTTKLIKNIYPTPTKDHIVLIMCPAWGIVFPPYNLAKITGLLRSNGYKVTVYDMNVDCYHLLQKKTGYDYWSSEKYHLWFGHSFETKILPIIMDYITTLIKEIMGICPDIIGFSLYNTNMACSKVLMEMLRSFMPSTPIIVGGPEAAQDRVINSVSTGIINYVFKGEAEETLLDFLENTDYNVTEQRKVVGTLESKIALDELPFPDYADYNLELYRHPDGVSIETSRGCIAQCSFCSETWFWKFRTRTPERVIEEIKDQITRYGIQRFWFVDSLVNGNLKSFRKLVSLILENNLNINWNSYARNDGRMDRDFIFKIVESGCTCLSFGVESGSQKVLDDMKKKISVWEIEQNLRDCYDAKMFTHVNWMVGFPTEEHIDFLHSMILIWNMSTYISAISPGMGAGPGVLSDLETNWGVYGITWGERAHDTSFLGRWFTHNYKNTALHRMVRIKIFAVLLDILDSTFSRLISNGQKFDNIKSFYNFTFDKNDATINSYIKQPNNLDLDIFKSNTGISLQESVANEYLGLAWLLFNIVNTDINLSFKFDPAVDLTSLGSFIATNYAADITISVKKNGEYNISVTHSLHHSSPNREWVHIVENEKRTGDKSFNCTINKTGNFSDLIVDYNVIGTTIHKQYANKTIPIKLSI